MSDQEGFDLEVLLGEDAAIEAGRKAAELIAEGQGGAWTRVAVPLLGDRIVSAIGERLADLDLLELLGQGWKASRELAAIPPGKRTHVRLGKHTVTHDFLAAVTVRLGPLTSEPLQFTLTVQAQVEAVELKIVDQHITRAGGGQVSVGAQLKYGEQVLGGQEDRWRRALPGDYRFKKPIRIVGAVGRGG